jgi:hypothetical protein
MVTDYVVTPSSDFFSVDPELDTVIKFTNPGTLTVNITVPSHATKNLKYNITASIADTARNVGCSMQGNNSPTRIPSAGPSYPYTQSFLLGDDEADQDYIGCQIQRWKVHNTAVNISAPTNIEQEGIMGYYEIDEQYPDVNDCSGVSVWDATAIGGPDLSSSNIRHHRFPDVNLYGQQPAKRFNSFDDFYYSYPMSVKVDMTAVYNNLPVDLQNEIVGYYIVRAKRDSYNKTVIDKGVLLNQWGELNGVNLRGGVSGQAMFRELQFENASWSMEYISNQVLFRNNVPNGDYLKHEAALQAIDFDDSDPKFSIYHVERNWVDNGELSYKGSWRFDNFDNKIIDSRLGVHRSINGNVLLPFQSEGFSANNGTYVSSVSRQKTGFLELEDAYPLEYPIGVNGRYRTLTSASGTDYNDAMDNLGIRIHYAAIKKYRDVYTRLESIKYVRAHNCMLDFVADADTPIYGGDIFITELHVTKVEAERTASTKIRQGGVVARVFLESEINSGLRHAETFSEYYYPKHFSANLTSYTGSPSLFTNEFLSLDYYLDMLGFNLDTNTIGDFEGDDPSVYDEVNKYQRPFVYVYNDDYSKKNEDKIYFPLSDNFDYCDDCEGEEPYNIYYSEKAQITDLQDNYKVILPANFKIMPGDAGEITNLFIEQDQLFCHTERALWALQTRPQQLTTNEDTLFIGTGEFLSVPPKKLISVQYGYAGSTDPFATIGTQYGTFFIDSMAGQVFQFGQGLKEISLNGLEKWFKDHGELEFLHEFKVATGEEYPIRGTSVPNSVGYIAVFDPYFKRYIIHKKDYNFVEGIDFQGTKPAPGGEITDALYYTIDTDTENITFEYWDGGAYVEVDLNNADWFENESWTLSYNGELNVWVSFHSYQPNYMFNNRINFYTSIRDNLPTVWLHGERNYQTYYGVKYDHIIETPINHDSGQEKLFTSFQMITNCYLYKDVQGRFVNDETVTFDRFTISNNNQSSGLRELVVKSNAYDDVTLPTNQTLIDRTENYWRFNRFRDIATNRNTETLFSSDWNDISGFFDQYGQGYIDDVVNPLSININKPYYEQSRFRSKALYLRLFFNPEQDYKISTELVTVLNKPSTR